MKNKNQNIILVKGDRGQIIIRGLNLDNGTARIYGEQYLGNVYTTKEIDGKTALAHAIFSTRIVDTDANCVL